MVSLLTRDPDWIIFLLQNKSVKINLPYSIGFKCLLFLIALKVVHKNIAFVPPIVPPLFVSLCNIKKPSANGYSINNTKNGQGKS